jgi:N,N'-diacetylchitobiose transport system substrate-binding protein
MKRTRFAGTSLATTVVLALALAACSAGGGGGSTAGPAGTTDTAAAPPATSAPATSEQTAAAGANIRVWLVSTDTPQDARDYLKQTFESENPGSTLTIEEQSWTGLVDKYTTALSGSDSPDVVEIGNTQAPAFTSAGAFLDLTSKFDELGGKDLLPGFVQIGSYDGKFYAAPYYSGARVVITSKEVVGDKGSPKTLDEFVANAKAMTTSTVSGMFAPGKDWRNFMSFVWANGGEIATQDASGKWVAGFESDSALKGLQEVQDIQTKANHIPADVDESDPQVPFCQGVVGYLMAPSWVRWSIAAAEDAPAPGCVKTFGSADNLSAFALPGLTAGTYAPVLAGGSNIAIPAKSNNPDLAYKALQIMLSDGYQKILAANGLVPALVSQAKYLPDDVFSQAAAVAAANGKLTPASEKWADVEASMILEDSFSKLAQGQDVATVAKALDDRINSILNG